MNKCLERIYNGFIKENPTFVLTLGMCPTLAVTTSAQNGLFMGLTTMVVLALSNAFISLLRKVIPDKVRIPAFIVIIASFVTMMELLLEAFLPSLYDALGLYIPLIVVNCIILGRAEAYASKNPVLPSFFDGIGMGLGFSFALTCIGAVRELLGAGSVFDLRIMPEGYVPASIFIMAPGAFFVLALLIAVQNKIKFEGEKRGRDMSKLGSGCSEDCMNCGDASCARRFYDADAGKADKADEKVAAGQKAKPKPEAAESKEENVERKKEQTEQVKAEKSAVKKPDEKKTEKVKNDDSKPEKIKSKEIKSKEIKTEETENTDLRSEKKEIASDTEAEKSKEKKKANRSSASKKKETDKQEEKKEE